MNYPSFSLMFVVFTIALTPVCKGSTQLDDEQARLIGRSNFNHRTYATIQMPEARETLESIEKLNAYGKYLAKDTSGECSAPGKVISATVSSTGMISLYFLGAEMFDNLLKIKGPGYALGACFEVPIASISYESNNYFWLQVKKKFEPSYRELFPLSTQIVKDTVFGALGFTMSSVAIYYTNHYLHPLIDEGVWIFISTAAVSNTIMAGLATKNLFSFFSSSAKTYIIKPCCTYLWGEKIDSRNEVKSWLSTIVKKVQNEQDSDHDFSTYLQDIQSGKLIETLIRLDQMHPTRTTTDNPQTDYFKGGQAIAGIIGGSLGIIGSYAMIPATAVSTKYMMQVWLGVDETTAESVSGVLGYIGGFTMGAYRGNGTKATFQRLHTMIDSSVALQKLPSIKSAVIESTTAVLSCLAVCPRIQIVLDNMKRGVGESLVIPTNAVATACNDYFGWKKTPSVLKSFNHKRSNQQILLALLNQLLQDCDFMHQKNIDELYEYIQSLDHPV